MRGVPGFIRVGVLLAYRESYVVRSGCTEFEACGWLGSCGDNKNKAKSCSKPEPVKRKISRKSEK
jgi:hypothetical protein